MKELHFPPYRLDIANEQLWREEQLIALRPKTFAILRYLVAHPNRLVTKEELLHAVWGDTLVSEEGLRDYLREIRHALGDDAEAPQFIETVRGRGYRFLPTITTQPVSSSRFQVPSFTSSLVPSPQPLASSTALPLPDKPSIIILPFVNLSNDPEQEYFSDGITEDLTNSLSRLASLFVISRTSAFTYKGKLTKVQDISKEMGVQYVLEGSVRRSDTQVRVSAQLIDAIADHHLWAERYDRPLTDIFAVQDEIVQKITTALAVKLTTGEEVRLTRFPTSNLEAYDHFLRGMEQYLRFQKDANIQARRLFARAIELDPQYAAAYALLSWTHWTDWYSQWASGTFPLERAFETAQQAVALDDSLPSAHMILGIIYLYQKQHERALTEAERALAANPNDADAYWTLGYILNMAGRPEDAIRAVKTAMRLNPYYPPYYPFDLGRAYRFLGQSEKAITALKEALVHNPNFLPARLQLAGVYSELDRKEEAQAEAAEILRFSPNFSLQAHRQSVPYKDPAILERYIDSLRKAGLK
ncbi:MAG TPA: winged helix-turn-helix domain-containing protein [Methylomirabilota bacterium]|nr:winged helix-turn-helix domain-containing protein [Methylomirabilota bacterium]